MTPEMKGLIKNKIEEMLSREYCCSIDDLRGKDVVFSTRVTDAPFLKILAYRDCVVVCTSEKLKLKIKDILQGKSRDEIFEIPFVYGQTIHCIPDGYDKDGKFGSTEYDFDILLDNEVKLLKGVSGFENSLSFDEKGYTPTKVVCIARDNGKIIGIAGASETYVSNVLEVGVDVLEDYRKSKIGTRLVKQLTYELLKQKIVPFYSASVTNIASQMVANRCGYIPMWIDTYGNIFDGSSVYNEMLTGIKIDI
ncbi:MAG: GNAT family N-acetyltransferase [Lachnospiraceae bacterium]|nr:GNAT family N-acetyltransferase [Lachnospiraceae bacterium]